MEASVALLPPLTVADVDAARFLPERTIERVGRPYRQHAGRGPGTVASDRPLHVARWSRLPMPRYLLVGPTFIVDKQGLSW